MFDDIDLKKMALAQYAGCDIEEIEEGSYDDCMFSINPRTKKSGQPPSHWIKRAHGLRSLLAELDPEIKTWQEWATIDDEEYMDQMLWQLQQHPEYNTGKYGGGMDPGDVFTVLGQGNSQAAETLIGKRVERSNQIILDGIKKMSPRYMVVYHRLKGKIKANDLHFEDFYVEENDLWHLIADHGYQEDPWHVYAIRAAFNGEEVEDRRNDMHVDDGEYLVLTEDEAEDRAYDYIEQSLWAFNADFLSTMTKMPYEAFEKLQELCEDANDAFRAMVDTTCGMRDFVDAAIDADGRGHFISHYDGKEREEHLNIEDEDEEIVYDEWYYIYRVN